MADPHFDKVALLLPLNGADASTTFTDESFNGLTVTGNSNAQLDTAEKKFGDSALLLDGGDDGLRIASTSALDMTGDFTLECWVNMDANSSAGQGLFDFRPTNLSGDHPKGTWFIEGNGSKLAMYNGSVVGNTGNAVTPGVWHHIAFTREGSTIRAFLDGNLEWSATPSTSFLASNVLGIGSNHGTATDEFAGHIDDIRITIGLARYTSSFPVPNAPHPTEWGDPYFGEVSLLLPLDGTDGDTTTTDESDLANTVTFNGNAQIDTAQSKFGGSSALFDGSGDYINCAGTSAGISGTGDFTIEFWFRANTLSGFTTLLDQREVLSGMDSAAPTLYFNGSTLYYYTNAGNRINFGTVSTGQWYHLALVRNGSTTTGYLDGVSKGTYADTTNYICYTGTPYFGRNSVNTGGGFNGWMDDIRITRGVARYTSAFTPPPYASPLIPATDPFFDDVILLFPFDGTDGDTTTTDESNSSRSFSIGGTSQISATQSKFGGTSLFINGNNNSCSMGSSGFDLSEPFTAEMWVYFTGGTGIQTLLHLRNAGTGSNQGLHIYRNGTTFSVDNGAAADEANGTISNNTWHHLAIVHDGTNIRGYLDGSEQFVDTAQVMGTTVQNAEVGGFADVFTSTLYEPTVYIDDFRFTQGIARYLSSFTPPPPHPLAPGGTDQTVSIGLAEETDDAFGFDFASSQTVALGLAEETDEALGFTAVFDQSISVGLAEETDETFPFNIIFDQSRAIGLATELGRARTFAVGVASSQTVAIGLAEETDSANDVDNSTTDLPTVYFVYEEHLDPIKRRGKAILSRELLEGESIVVERKTPITNDIDFANQDILDPRQLEYAFDKICFIEQEIEGHFCDCRGGDGPGLVPETPPVVTPPIIDNPDPVCEPYACDAIDGFALEYIPNVDGSNTMFSPLITLDGVDQAETEEFAANIFPINTGVYDLVFNYNVFGDAAVKSEEEFYLTYCDGDPQYPFKWTGIEPEAGAQMDFSPPLSFQPLNIAFYVRAHSEREGLKQGAGNAEIIQWSMATAQFDNGVGTRTFNRTFYIQVSEDIVTNTFSISLRFNGATAPYPEDTAGTTTIPIGSFSTDDPLFRQWQVWLINLDVDPIDLTPGTAFGGSSYSWFCPVSCRVRVGYQEGGEWKIFDESVSVNWYFNNSLSASSIELQSHRTTRFFNNSMAVFNGIFTSLSDLDFNRLLAAFRRNNADYVPPDICVYDGDEIDAPDDDPQPETPTQIPPTQPETGGSGDFEPDPPPVTPPIVDPPDGSDPPDPPVDPPPTPETAFVPPADANLVAWFDPASMRYLRVSLWGNLYRISRWYKRRGVAVGDYRTGTNRYPDKYINGRRVYNQTLLGGVNSTSANGLNFFPGWYTGATEPVIRSALFLVNNMTVASRLYNEDRPVGQVPYVYAEGPQRIPIITPQDPLSAKIILNMLDADDHHVELERTSGAAAVNGGPLVSSVAGTSGLASVATGLVNLSITKASMIGPLLLYIEWNDDIEFFRFGQGFIENNSGRAGNEYDRYNFGGEIGDQMFWNTALTTEQRNEAEGYIMHKYSLQSMLPDGHPYKDTAPEGY